MTELVGLIKDLPFQNLDLLTVGVTIAAILIIGVVVYLTDRKSITSKSFLYLAVSASFWSIFNYLNYQSNSPSLTLLSLRLLMFCAVWFAFSLYQFLFVFPERQIKFTNWNRFLLPSLVIIVLILTLTPLVFNHIVGEVKAGTVAAVENGPGIILFAALVFYLVGGGIYIYIRKVLKAAADQKKQFEVVLYGIIITFSLIILLNFIFPAFLGVYTFIPFGALFIFPFIAFTSYAILKHKLFNVKVAATGILVFVLSIVTFLEIIFSDSFPLVLFRSGVFLLVLTTGLLLIKSVFREVEQREKIEKLAKDLQISSDKLFVANEKLKELDKAKTEFVSMAAHQLRAPLTAIKGYSSMLLEGSFGQLEEKVRGAVDVVFQSSERLVNVIEDFLNITRIELGKMKYDLTEFDFSQLVRQIVGESEHTAARKNLSLALTIAPDTNYTLKADFGKIGEVISNLVDNAIKYSDRGPIVIKLERLEGKIRLSVKDNGVGIDPATMANLFQKFTRAADASKTNASGTGLGLYVAKQIVEAHNGRIWAESPGRNQGSTFLVEL